MRCRTGDRERDQKELARYGSLRSHHHTGPASDRNYSLCVYEEGVTRALSAHRRLMGERFPLITEKEIQPENDCDALISPALNLSDL